MDKFRHRRCSAAQLGLWTILLGVVLISTHGHAQALSDSLQFQPISGQPHQQPQQTTTTQGFNQNAAANQQPNPTTLFPGSSSIPVSTPVQQQQVNHLDATRYQQVIDGSERFALQLFARTVNALESIKHNFIMSPFSIWSLLVVTAEGARGRTYQELQSVLGLSDDFFYTREVYKQFQLALSLNTSSVELTTNQIIYSDRNRPLDRDFESTVETFYKTEEVSVDFSDIRTTYKQINDHIRQATHGRIEKIINVEDLKDATLILASTIFFKGMWRMPFNRSHTTEAPFYDENGLELGRVNMMFNRGPFPYTAIADLDSHILELPYGLDNRLSMIIVLPRKGVSLQSVIQRLPNVRLQRIYDELQKSAQEFEDDEVEVFLPRFTIMADFTLNGILENMGILDVFSAADANLSKITSTPIYLSRLLHKAKIEVNEEGTVASAATAGTFANKATPPRFAANRPFAYLIVDKITRILLFCGQAENPNKF